MGAFLGLLLGVGLLLIWCSGDRAPQRASRRSPGWTVRRDELIKQAGIGGVSPAQLLGAQFSSGLAVGLLVQVLTMTIAVSCCFAVFAFVTPVGVVRRVRQRRQVALRELWPEAIDTSPPPYGQECLCPKGFLAWHYVDPSRCEHPSHASVPGIGPAGGSLTAWTP
jgi:hypothetical protein